MVTSSALFGFALFSSPSRVRFRCSHSRPPRRSTRACLMIRSNSDAKNKRISCDDAKIVNDTLSKHPPKSHSTFDVIVVGNGPLGSAIGLHASVSSSGKKSVLILDCGSESLSSGSDDLGRIVRPLDAEGRDEWTRFNIDSIESFAKVQEESEIAFFEKKGSLSVGSDLFVSKPASLYGRKRSNTRF